MSGPKHTPEEWRAAPDPLVACVVTGHPEEGDFRVIAECDNEHVHLLAAAPRLAEALKGVMNSIEAHVYLKEPPTDPDEYDSMMQPLWEEARAALREAGVSDE